MLAWGYPKCFLLAYNCNFRQLQLGFHVCVITRETSAKTGHKANTLQETVPQKAYDQNGRNRSEGWVCIPTSEYLWTSQDIARNWYQLLQLRGICILKLPLFHSPTKKSVSYSPFSGLFYRVQLEAWVPSVPLSSNPIVNLEVQPHITKPVAFTELFSRIWCWDIKTPDNSTIGRTGKGMLI